MLLAVSVVLTCTVVAFAAAKKDKTIEKLQRDQKNAEAQIEQTTSQLEGTRSEANRQLQRLDELQREITNQEEIISAAKVKSDSVRHAITNTDSRLGNIAVELQALKDDYKNTLRQLQLTTSPVNNLAFVLSAKSANECLSRIRYLQAYARWRRRKANAITDTRADLDQQQQELKALHAEQHHQVARLNLANQQLQSNQADTHRLVDSLGRRQSELKKALDEQKKRLMALQRSIDIRITQQIKPEPAKKPTPTKEKTNKPGNKPGTEKPADKPANKPANKPAPKPAEKPAQATAAPDRTLQGGFAANKGNLLFPVAGRYSVVRKFGRNPHPYLRDVYIDNSGIDISVGPGTKARAVYGGTVSGIFRQEGYGTVVMVRHGSYITIYAGLSDIAVHNGQELTTGQTIGTVGAQSGESPTLHFELRNDRTKLNPMQWIK